LLVLRPGYNNQHIYCNSYHADEWLKSVWRAPPADANRPGFNTHHAGEWLER
jgi:hypothetical protein